MMSLTKNSQILKVIQTNYMESEINDTGKSIETIFSSKPSGQRKGKNEMPGIVLNKLPVIQVKS